MTKEKISTLLSLLAALIMVVINFFPWYTTLYDGKPKVKTWGKIVLFISFVLVIIAIIFLFL